MRNLFVEKVVVHMGVGEAGDKLTKAVDLMKTITGGTPVRGVAKQTNTTFGIRKGAPISCRVTLRGKPAEKFLSTALDIVERKIMGSQIDRTGNFSFGIEEHTDFPGMSYDPQIGIYGMDVNVVLARRAYNKAIHGAAQAPAEAAREPGGCDCIPQGDPQSGGALTWVARRPRNTAVVQMNARCAAGSKPWCGVTILCSAASVSVNGHRKWALRR
jgi:large subunit ribosomal protein L5